MEPKGAQVFQELPRDSQGPQGSLDYLECLERPVFKDHKVMLGYQALEVLKVRKDLSVLLVRLLDFNSVRVCLEMSPVCGYVTQKTIIV